MVYLEFDAGMCRGNMAFNYSRHTNNKVFIIRFLIKCIETFYIHISTVFQFKNLHTYVSYNDVCFFDYFTKNLLVFFFYIFFANHYE